MDYNFTQLLEDARTLVEHYGVGLETFNRQRDSEIPELSSPIVFAGPAGYPFPRDAEQRFKTTVSAYWKDLNSPSSA